MVVEDLFELIKNIHYWHGFWTLMAQLQYRYQETLVIMCVCRPYLFLSLSMADCFSDG